MKAALDDAIAAFARRPELAAALWERLLQSVVVAPSAPEEAPVARYDITYQLNEIEVCSCSLGLHIILPPLNPLRDALHLQARAEDYAEVLAFVRLLNALLRASGEALLDQGRPYAHFTQFVRADVLGQLHGRAYRSVLHA